MIYDFKYKGINTCDTAVIACIDFRFWQTIIQHVQNDLGIKEFDFPMLPGSAKAINDSDGKDIVMKSLEIPVNLHKISRIIIFNHTDCGACGGIVRFNGDMVAEQQFHKNELVKAKKKILDHFPGKEIILYFVKPVNNGEKLEIISIND